MFNYIAKCVGKGLFAKRLVDHTGSREREPKNVSRDFPGSPLVKTLHFHCRGHGVPSLVGKLRSRKPKKKKNVSKSTYGQGAYTEP